MAENTTAAIIASVFGGGVGGGILTLLGISRRAKADERISDNAADTAEHISDNETAAAITQAAWATALSAIDLQAGQIDRLRADVAEMEGERENSRLRIATLETTVATLKKTVATLEKLIEGKDKAIADRDKIIADLKGHRPATL